MAHQKQFIDDQNKMLAGKRPDSVTLAQQLSAQFNAMGISGTGDTERKRRGDITLAVQDRVMAEEARTGKKLSDDERKRVIDNVLIDKVFVADDTWFDEEKLIAEVPDKDLADAYVKVYGQEINIAKVPAAERAIIIQDLKEMGRRVTESNIVKLWLKAQSKR